MTATVTLNKNHEFRRLYAKGRSAVSPTVVVYARHTGRGVNRVGFTVTAKVGKAVVRNRVRRRLREIYRLNGDALAAGTDMVVVARARSAEAAYAALERDYLSCCRRLGLLTGEVRP